MNHLSYFTVFCISIQACCAFYIVRRLGAHFFFDNFNYLTQIRLPSIEQSIHDLIGRVSLESPSVERLQIMQCNTNNKVDALENRCTMFEGKLDAFIPRDLVYNGYSDLSEIVGRNSEDIDKLRMMMPNYPSQDLSYASMLDKINNNSEAIDGLEDRAETLFRIVKANDAQIDSNADAIDGLENSKGVFKRILVEHKCMILDNKEAIEDLEEKVFRLEQADGEAEPEDVMCVDCKHCYYDLELSGKSKAIKVYKCDRYNIYTEREAFRLSTCSKFKKKER